MLNGARQDAGARWIASQSFLSDLKQREIEGSASPWLVATGKGLFFVLLYGAVEFSLTRAVEEYASIVNGNAVPLRNVNQRLRGLALNAELKSAAEVSRPKIWRQRDAIFKNANSQKPANIDASALGAELSNAWAASFANVFQALGIPGQHLYDPRVRQYIDEIALKRNAVAHGRESAEQVGRAYTFGDLQRLQDEAMKQHVFIFIQLERALEKRWFVDIRAR